MKKLLLLLLACTGVLPVALGQTGRIAHFSHGGSVGALLVSEEANDNFGDEITFFHADSVRYLSATAVIRYNKRNYSPGFSFQDTLQLPTPMTHGAALRYLRENLYLLRHGYSAQQYPITYIGFDSTNTTKPVRPARRRHSHKTTGVRTPVLPADPGRAAALVISLVSVGWLLGKKRAV